MSSAYCLIPKYLCEQDDYPTTTRKPFERVLNREKASPAHLRGRRPPSLVSSENDEEVRQISLLSQQRQLLLGPESPTHTTIPISVIKSDDIALKQSSPTHTDNTRHQTDLETLQSRPTLPRSGGPPPTPRSGSSRTSDLQRRGSLRRSRPDPEGSSTSSAMASSLNRSQSFRIKRDNNKLVDNKPKVPASPTVSRRDSTSQRDNREKSSSVKLTRTPSLRRKSEIAANKQENKKESSSGPTKPVGLVNINISSFH